MLTNFIQVVGVLPPEEFWPEDEGALDEDVGQSGECPPAHEQTVLLGKSATSSYNVQHPTI